MSVTTFASETVLTNFCSLEVALHFAMELFWNAYGIVFASPTNHKISMPKFVIKVFSLKDFHSANIYAVPPTCTTCISDSTKTCYKLSNNEGMFKQRIIYIGSLRAKLIVAVANLVGDSFLLIATCNYLHVNLSLNANDILHMVHMVKRTNIQ